MSDTPAVPPTPPTPAAADAALKAELDKALSRLADMEKRENERKANDEQAALTKDFPTIKDWSVVAGKTFEEKKAAAAKLVAMFPAPEPRAAVDVNKTPPPHNPGDRFTPPPMGAPGGEAGQAQVITEKMKQLGEAVNAGNVSRAFDLCVELQPNGVKRLYAEAAKS